MDYKFYSSNKNIKNYNKYSQLTLDFNSNNISQTVTPVASQHIDLSNKNSRYINKSMQLHNNSNIHEISLATLKRPNEDLPAAHLEPKRPKNTFRINSSFILNDNSNFQTDDDIRMKALVHIDSYLTSKGISPIGQDQNIHNNYDTPNGHKKRYWSLNIDQDNYRLYSDKKKMLFRMNETEPEPIIDDFPIDNDLIQLECKNKIE